MNARGSIALVFSLLWAACGGEASPRLSAAGDASKPVDSSAETGADATPVSDAPQETASLFDVDVDDAGKDSASDGCVATACPIKSGPGTYCGFDATMKPYSPRLLGGFQSVAGTGAQSTISIRFSKPVESATITAYDCDVTGNRMEAHDAAGKLLATVDFAFDAKPGVLAPSTRTVTAKGIAGLRLVPGAADFVYYDNFSVTVCP